MRLVSVFAALALAAPLLALTPAANAADAPKKTINYDCSKAGNANKAACKGAAPAAAAKPAAPAATDASKKTINYDCTKKGNANKAACKGAATAAAAAPSKPPEAPAGTPAPAASKTQAAATISKAAGSIFAPRPATRTQAQASAAGAPGSRVVAYTEKNGKVVHYDCNKAGNLNKTACK